MRAFPIALFVCVLSISPLCMQKPEGWLPVTSQDLEIKDVPGYKNSSAIQLYFDYYKDDEDRFETVYRRIKILRSGGMDRANAEILLEPDISFKEMAARTIHPDGSIVEFTGKPFEKTVIKRKGLKFSARIFAFPAVTPGSIVEYRYTLTLPRGYVKSISAWPIQDDLFTLKARFRFRAYQDVVVPRSEWSNMIPRSRVSFAYMNQVDATVPEKKAGNLVEMELSNIPPFQAEEYMPPAEDYRPTLLFYYGGRETASPDLFWQSTGKLVGEWMEKYIGDRREIRSAAEQAMGGETDPEARLRKLYSRAQQLRNLTYERKRTEEENKKENIKPARDVEDVLKRGYGRAAEINRLFTALARAAGFEAYIVFVAGRDERSFVRKLMVVDQFDSEIVLVKVNGKDVWLDPGTRYCPYGMLRWTKTATTAMKIGRQMQVEFMTTPPAAVSPIHRAMNVTLGADGSLKGDLLVRLEGEDALEHRLESVEKDEAGRRKALEDEIAALLPKGAVVKAQNLQGWESGDSPATARFTIEIPEFAALTGKRMVFPTVLLSTLQKGMFTSEIRRYPIVFSYPFLEEDEVAIRLPEGYMLDAPPYARQSGLAYAKYAVTSALKADQLTTTRSLRIEQAELPPEKYYELKSFFTIVHAGDEGQAVAQRSESHN